MKIGEKIIMHFYCAGMVSDEQETVSDIDEKRNIIYLDNDCDDAWMFDMETGRCLNDNTAFGCKRFIDPIIQ